MWFRGQFLGEVRHFREPVRPVDRDRSCHRVDLPDDRDPGVEIGPALQVHVLGRVAWGGYLDDKKRRPLNDQIVFVRLGFRFGRDIGEVGPDDRIRISDETDPNLSVVERASGLRLPTHPDRRLSVRK